MRRVRGVGLVLVDEGGRGVDRTVSVVGACPHARQSGARPGESGAGQHHEIRLAAGNIERIVRHQWNEHGAVAALVHEIEAVIEELAEQREPGIERRRQAFVRRGVGR